MIVSESSNIYSNLPSAAGPLYDRDDSADVSVSLRPFDADDTKFVLHSWLRSMRGHFRDAADEDYYPAVQNQIRRISTTARVLVACDSEKPWFILGYCVAEAEPPATGPVTIYYTFTKLSYRRRGIARAMLASHGCTGSRLIITPYWTHYCKELKANGVRLRYNPWLIEKLPA